MSFQKTNARKPCYWKRKRVVLLALGALDAQEACALRRHLERCEGCGGYFQQISVTAEILPASAPEWETTVPEGFHHRLRAAINRENGGPALEAVARTMGRTLWVWRMAAVGVVALLLAVLLWPTASRRSVPGTNATQAQSVSAPGLEPGLAPTIRNYELAAYRSLDDFDTLLTRQADQNLTPAPILRASTGGQFSAAE